MTVTKNKQTIKLINEVNQNTQLMTLTTSFCSPNTVLLLWKSCSCEDTVQRSHCIIILTVIAGLPSLYSFLWLHWSLAPKRFQVRSFYSEGFRLPTSLISFIVRLNKGKSDILMPTVALHVWHSWNWKSQQLWFVIERRETLNLSYISSTTHSWLYGIPWKRTGWFGGHVTSMRKWLGVSVKFAEANKQITGSTQMLVSRENYSRDHESV